MVRHKGKMAAKTHFWVDLSNYMTHRAEISSCGPQVSRKFPCGSLKLLLGAVLLTGFNVKVLYSFSHYTCNVYLAH